MSWFEVEYLIKINIDGLTDVIALFASIQFAVFAVIYFLRDVHDLLVRHAVMFLYSLTWIFTFSRVMMDMIIIGSYTRMLAEIVKEERGAELIFGDDTGDFFIAILTIVFVSLWATAFYFLYFHKFSDESKG